MTINKTPCYGQADTRNLFNAFNNADLKPQVGISIQAVCLTEIDMGTTGVAVRGEHA